MIDHDNNISIQTNNPDELLLKWINKNDINTLDELIRQLKLFHDSFQQFASYLLAHLGIKTNIGAQNFELINLT